MNENRDDETKINKLQEEQIPLFHPVITGIMLGDGTIDKIKYKNNHSRLKLLQRKKSKDLNEDLLSQLCMLNLCGTMLKYFQYGQFYGYETFSRTCWYFGKLEQIWYDNRTKIIPKNIILTNEAVAYWFMCDGDETGEKYRVAKFNTYGFSECEVDFLVSKLHQLNINAHKERWVKEKNQFLIKISKQDDVDSFNDMVKPYILPCFEYKLKPRK